MDGYIWIYECMDMQLKDSYEISYILVKNNLSITLNEIEIHSIKYHISQTLNRLDNNVPTNF